MNGCPCKDCGRRTLTCHAFCGEYEEWKKQREAINQARCEQNDSFTDRRRMPFWRLMDKRSVRR